MKNHARLWYTANCAVRRANRKVVSRAKIETEQIIANCAVCVFLERWIWKNETQHFQLHEFTFMELTSAQH